jgi:hypothetical protein
MTLIPAVGGLAAPYAALHGLFRIAKQPLIPAERRQPPRISQQVDTTDLERRHAQ